MNDLPRLELTEDPNKNNDYIIYRYPTKKTVNTKMVPSKHAITSKHGIKKISSTKSNGRKRKTRSRKSRKGFFNVFI